MNIDIYLWKKRKKELNLTFDTLADLSNVSRRQLLYLFNGKGKNTGIETVQRIERALGIESNSADEHILTEEEKNLISLISELTDDEVTELSNYIDYIISKRK